MVKFLMPIVAMVAVLLIVTMATAVVEQDYSMQGVDAPEGHEILGTVPQAGMQEVPDPGSCRSLRAANEISDLSDKFTCNRRPVRNILRQGVRLLNFLTC